VVQVYPVALVGQVILAGLEEEEAQAAQVVLVVRPVIQVLPEKFIQIKVPMVVMVGMAVAYMAARLVWQAMLLARAVIIMVLVDPGRTVDQVAVEGGMEGTQ